MQEPTTISSPHGTMYGEEISVQLCELVVISGPHEGQRFLLEQELTSIGRAPWCDIILDQDPLISQQHIELQFDQDGLVVRDCNSRNGMFFMEHRVHEMNLYPGSRIRIGNSLLELRSLSKSQPLAISYQDATGTLLGKSATMRKLFSLIKRVAHLGSPVLLQGETGTGKTCFARAIHQQSSLAKQPFVAVNCASLAKNLIESELFGHVKGAFTSATETRKGYIEAAHHGTLFLDEIGELSQELQAKLLEVLECKKIRRVGSTQEIDVDFRLITATHRNLQSMIQDGFFRADLYFRISVVMLHIPPLREHTEDILLLSHHFLRQLSPNKAYQLSPSALHYLEQYSWPGNIRELRNKLERAVAFVEGDTIALEDLSDFALASLGLFAQPTPQPQTTHLSLRKDFDSESSEIWPVPFVLPRPENSSTTKPEWLLSLYQRWTQEGSGLRQGLEEIEKWVIEQTLVEHRGHVAAAAKALGISRGWLYKRMDKYNIVPPR